MYEYFCILDGARSIESSRCSPHNQANNPQTTTVVHRYGNEICLLDATYKNSRNALPLFFVAVPTNTCYQVIASFIISSETTDSISQALKSSPAGNLTRNLQTGCLAVVKLRYQLSKLYWAWRSKLHTEQRSALGREWVFQMYVGSIVTFSVLITMILMICEQL